VLRKQRLPSNRSALCVGLALSLAALVACQPASPPPAEDSPAAATDSPPPGAVWEGDAFAFHEIRDGVYHAVGTGNLTVGCNSSIVVNDDDVLLVDSHMTPAASWALREELKNLTDKPIKYVVNTHFHFDHSHGNQIFADDVEIIGHRFTRDQLVSGASKRGRGWELFVEQLPEQIKQTEQKIADAGDDGDAKAELERQLEIQKHYLDATNAIVPTPPTITLTKRMSLTRGGRQIELLFFGRGHTGGDVVVYLPQERVLMTGDLVTAGIPYMGDGYLEVWADTIEELKSLDFDVVLPGHGQAFEDIGRLDHIQAYMRDLWTQIVAEHEAGTSADEAAGKIDMTGHAEHFAQITGPGVHPHAVARSYALLDGTER